MRHETQLSSPASLSVSGSSSPTAAMHIINPTIPYLGPIPPIQDEGSCISLEGSTPEDAKRFYVNLLCGKSEYDNIALHINPRFDKGAKVVFNTRENDKWGSEQIVNSMPFSQGLAFKMKIIVTANRFQIHVDGREFYTFAFRMPVNRVAALQIGGDVTIHVIDVNEA